MEEALEGGGGEGVMEIIKIILRKGVFSPPL